MSYSMGFRCLLFLVFFQHVVSAQFYSNGQNSSAVHWRQINTENFQIIFPADFEAKAHELANIIVYANEQARIYLKSKPRKISIIIQNNTTVDNGFVTLAPWRSEFYSMPSQENEGVRWLKKLAVHEYRHVVQLEKFKEGVGKVLYLLMGDQGLGALTVLTTPLWFLEGDAVSVETRKTEVGRGNYGPFLREIRAQVVEGDSISYEKATFGSYSDYVTDHYKIGYELVEYVKLTYGEEVWDSVLTCVSKNPFVPYPFSYHLKKITGKTTSQIYGEVYSKIKRKWSHRKFTESEVLSPGSKSFVSYTNAVLDNEGLIYCVKSSYDEITRIVRLDSTGEKLIHVPGRMDMNNLSFGGGKLLWSEKRRDPRWQYRDYSELIVFDLLSKKRKRIKRRTKWFAGNLNEDGEQIVLVEQSKSNEASLLIVDLDGNEKHRLIVQEGTVFHPIWEKGNIVFINLANEQSYLLKWNAELNSVDTLLQTGHPISYPSVASNGYVLQVSVNGYDEIVLVENSKMKSIVKPEFGLQFPQVFKGDVFYSDYHSRGMKICKSKLIRGEELNEEVEDHYLSPIDTATFVVKKYYPLLHLFNFHSWAPISIYPDDQEVKLGLSLFSQNKLSSSALSLNYDYDWIQEGQEFKASYEFAHFYPVFFVDYGKSISPNSKVQNISTSIDEDRFSGGVKFSWLLDNNKYRKNIYLQGAYVNSIASYDFSSTYVDTTIQSENLQLLAYYSTDYRKARKNIYSKWSLACQARFFTNLKNNNQSVFGKIATTTPGLFKNHGLKLTYENQVSNSVFVPNYIAESRGYLNHFYRDAQKVSFEYALPLLYPDYKLGKLAYIQRLRMSAFLDWMEINNGDQKSDLNSFGVELNMEFNPLRYSYLTQLGVEVAYTEGGEVFFSPIFKIIY